MFEVLSPPTAAKVRHQPSRVLEGGPCPTSPLRLGSLWHWWRRWWWEAPPTGHRPGGQTTLLTLWLHTRHLWYTSWVTNGAAAMSLPSHCRPSAVLCCATHGVSFTCGGVRNDSPPHGPLQRLHCLLVGCGWAHRVWLSDRHHLGCARHRGGSAGICWASLPGWDAPAILFAVPHNPVLLLTPGSCGGAVAPPGVGAPGGGSLHLL